MFGALTSCAVALVFPLFASYRALTSNDISLIRPWLMYWVVLATCLSAESVFYPLLQYLPFYGLLRLGFLGWLVLPQTQGAIQLYVTRLEPWLSSHDQRIDNAISKAIRWMDDSPLSLVLSFLGIELPRPRTNNINANGQQADLAPQGNSITDMLMSRFRMPMSPDLNLTAYLPAFMSGKEPPNPEDVSQLRSRMMGMLRTLDASVSSSASPSEPTQFSDEYDIVDSPKPSPPPSHHTETEIEREVEASITTSGSKSEPGSTAESNTVRKRWW